MLSKRIYDEAEGIRYTTMSTVTFSETISDVRLNKLDGRSTNAPGMPLGMERAYKDSFKRAVAFYGDCAHWDEDRFKREYVHACELATHPDRQAYPDYISDKWSEYTDSQNKRNAIRDARDNLKSQMGPREFTLTYSPEWYVNDTDAQFDMKVAIDKLTRYYKDEIIEFHAIGEFTKNNRAHVHAWYHLTGGKKITDKNFKRAWKHWNPKKKLGNGFEGGHHSTISRISDFSGYAEKHLEDAWMNVNITNADDNKTS